jgi:hypothetical protein
MTPKEKAGQLVQKYAIKLPLENYGRVDKQNGLIILDYNIDVAKQCALIAVDELIKNQEKITKNINRHLSIANIEIQDTGNFWIEVKQEIENYG